MSEKARRVWRIVGHVAAFVFLAVVVFICSAAIWMMSRWDQVDLNQLLVNLKIDLGGNESAVGNFLLWTILPTLLAVGIGIPIYFRLRKWRKPLRIYMISLSGTSLVLGIVVMSITANYLNLGDYIKYKTQESEFVRDSYVNPADVEMTFPEKKRNLIVLTLESMETTYADKVNGGGFTDNYIPELTLLAKEGEDFRGEENRLNGAVCMPNTNWTMAALFAHSTGLPMDVPLGQNNMDTQDEFFPGVTALGDILHNQGYTQTFMCGSNATFGGRRLYYKEHGDFLIRDYNYYHALPRSNPNHVDWDDWWGFRDLDLFRFAKQELIKNSEAYKNEGTPFHFSFLTVDTHFDISGSDDDGHPCDLCPHEFEGRYADVIACSSKQVTAFVEWFYGKDGNEDIDAETREFTTMVILGDHPTMSKNFCKKISTDINSMKRRTYVNYLNSPVAPSDPLKTRVYTPFDSFPTTLASLGVTIPGERLALGTNLFASEVETHTERIGIKKEVEELKKKSELLAELLKVNVYDMDYLKRKGWLPTATLEVADVDQENQTFSVSIGKIGCKQYVEDYGPAEFVVYFEGQSKTYQVSDPNEKGYYVKDIPLSDFASGANDFVIDYFLYGKASGNRYTLGTTTLTIG